MGLEELIELEELIGLEELIELEELVELEELGEPPPPAFPIITGLLAPYKVFAIVNFISRYIQFPSILCGVQVQMWVVCSILINRTALVSRGIFL
jgi:hypothetical protein